MSALNLEALRRTPVTSEPFPFLIVPEFIPPEAIQRINDSFPLIVRGGSFPLSSLEYGDEFAAFCEELRGSGFRTAIEEKLEIDLSQRPTTLTVRGHCRTRDGKIHTDSKSKLVTILLYLNGGWEAAGGQLRLLRSEHNLDDYIAEVPPAQGTLLCFVNRPNAWHGHQPFEGPRRVMQLNWVTDATAARRSERRHGLSALIKQLNPFRRAA